MFNFTFGVYIHATLNLLYTADFPIYVPARCQNKNSMETYIKTIVVNRQFTAIEYILGKKKSRTRLEELRESL